MASLTTTAYYSRLAIKYGGVALLCLMVGRFAWGRFVAWWEATHPKAPPSPNVAFGVLPNVVFPNKTQPQVTYRVDFPTGELPNLGDRAEVYLMPAKRSPLQALDQAKEVAKNLGYDSEAKQRNEDLYLFEKAEPLPAKLNIFIYWGVFIHSVDWSVNQDFLKEKKLPTEAQAIDEVKSMIKKAGLLEQDLNKGEAKVSYLKANNGAYRETVSLSEADFLQVDLYRQPFKDDVYGYPPDPKQGVVRAVVSGNNESRIVQLEYYYYPLDLTKAGVYPLKTAQQAFYELQTGKGYIAQLDADISQVTVRRMELGYFESRQPQDYYQPTYIFKGDNNFVAYVAAVAPPTQVPTLTPKPPR